MSEEVARIFCHELVTGKYVCLIVQEQLRGVCAMQFDVLGMSTYIRQFGAQLLYGFKLRTGFVIVQAMKKRW